jgi:O-antigen ligase
MVKYKSSEYPLLWWLAAGISVTIIWLPIINSIMCIAFAFLWLFQSRFRFRILYFPLFLLFISFYIATAVSFFYSTNKPEALRILQLKLPLFLFPLVFASGVKWKKEQVRVLLLLFSWSVALFCIISISKAVFSALLFGDLQFLFGYNIIPFKYIYPSVASLFCVFSALIHLNELAEKEKLLSVHLIPLLLFGTTLILLSNRMGILLFIIITLFYLLRTVQSTMVKFSSVLFMILVLVFLYFANQTFREKMQVIVQFNSEKMIKLDKDASLGKTWDGLQLRVAIWTCAADVVIKHFWTGIGVGDAQQQLQQAYENRKFYFASKYNTYNAHNQFIEQWLMTGVAGALFFIISIYVSVYMAFKTGNLLYLLFLFVFLFFCITESILEISKGVVWFSFFNSIFAFHIKKSVASVIDSE